MLGLTFEKLLLIGFLAAVILGPRRLPAVVAGVAGLARDLRRTVDAARVRAADELGVPADAAQWRALDPRQYDPRRIIAEALAAPAVPTPRASAPPLSALTPSAPVPSDPTPSMRGETDPIAEGETRDLGAARHPVSPTPETAPATRRVRVGTSAHPRWVVIAVEEEPEGSATVPVAASDGRDREVSSGSPDRATAGVEGRPSGRHAG